MKKRIFAICMTAAILTSCGSTVTSPDSDSTAVTSDAEPGAASDTEPGAGSGNKKQYIDTELEFLDYGDIYFPYHDVDPSHPEEYWYAKPGETKFFRSHGYTSKEPDSVNDVVFYCWGHDSEEYHEDDGLKFQEASMKDLINSTLSGYELDRYIYTPYEATPTIDDFTINSEEEINLLDHKTLRATGTVHLDYKGEFDVNYIISFTFLPDAELLWWCAFTKSNEQDVLDELQYYADLPLNNAKLNPQ